MALLPGLDLFFVCCAFRIAKRNRQAGCIQPAFGAKNKGFRRFGAGFGGCMKAPVPHFQRSEPLWNLFTQAEFLDQCAVLENIFFRIVRQQAFALAHLVQQGAARRVVFRVGAQVRRKTVDLVG